jgi:hypothetical protein
MLETLLCRAGIHARCRLGRNRLGTTNRCPYWEGWRAGYAWAEREAR